MLNAVIVASKVMSRMSSRRAEPALGLPSGIKPGKIQPLPVQVFYNLPAPTSPHLATSTEAARPTRDDVDDTVTSWGYATLLAKPQDVFVHRPVVFGGAQRARRARQRHETPSGPLLNGRLSTRGGATASPGPSVDGDAVKREEESAEEGSGDGRLHKRRRVGASVASDGDVTMGEEALGEDEACEVLGSVSLKAVLRAVCLASPEILLQLEPPHADSQAESAAHSDISVYAPILGAQPRHPPPGLVAASARRLAARPGFSSPNPAADWQASSPAPATPASNADDRLEDARPVAPAQEGKGLLTWVLDEADPGKSLVKGRLVRSPAFQSVLDSGAADDDEADGLQALLKSMEGKEDTEGEDDGEWGLQVFVTLRTLPVASGVPKRASLLGALFGKPAQAAPTAHNRRESWTKPASKLRLSAVPDAASQDRPASAAGPSNPVTPPAKTARFVNAIPIARPSEPDASDVVDLTRQHPETPKRTQQVQQQYGELSKSSPNTIMMMAQTLLANPTLERIDLVQKMVGKDDFVRLVADMGVKLPSTSLKQEAGKGHLPPLPQHAPLQSGAAAPVPPRKVYVCDNCRTTETSIWRVKQLPGGKERRVCNDCGVYFNQTKKMRPKELWGKPSSAAEPHGSNAPSNDVLATPRKRSADATFQTPRRSTRLSSSAARPRSPDDDPGSSPKPRAARSTPGRAAKSKNIVNSSAEMIPPSTKAQRQIMTLTKPNKAPPPSSPPFQPAPESEFGAAHDDMDLEALLGAGHQSDEKEEAKFTQKELELLLALTANPELDDANEAAAGPVAASHLFNLDDVLETSSPWEADPSAAVSENFGM